MKFIALAAAALSLISSCTLSFAAPLDAETGIVPLDIRSVDVVPIESQVLARSLDIVQPDAAQVDDIAARGVDIVVAAIVDTCDQVDVIVKALCKPPSSLLTFAPIIV